MKHIAYIEIDLESLRRGGSTRTARCVCGWQGPQRSTLELVVDDAVTHEQEPVHLKLRAPEYAMVLHPHTEHVFHVHYGQTTVQNTSDEPIFIATLSHLKIGDCFKFVRPPPGWSAGKLVLVDQAPGWAMPEGWDFVLKARADEELAYQLVIILDEKVSVATGPSIPEEDP